MSSVQSRRRRSKSAILNGDIDPQRAQHLDASMRDILTDDGVVRVLVNDSESPLAWLARRKGRDGRAMISPEQFIAGERLRADFTRANMTPRVTSSWEAPTGRSSGGGGAGAMTDMILAAQQTMRQAMAAVGPEFAGLLMDVCCFLRGLEDVEHERGWPPRSAKVVLQLGLDRLARHYGVRCETRGKASASIKTWTAGENEA
jgi:hypothetical protein